MCLQFYILYDSKNRNIIFYTIIVSLGLHYVALSTHKYKNTPNAQVADASLILKPCVQH